jgi:penicillin-binding protein A
MNRSIRGVGAFVILLFVALVVQLVNLQVVQANRFNHDPRNTRAALRDYSRNRGVIQTADGVVVAQSVATKDSFHYQRQYPTGPLFAFVTGYQSFIYGTDGVENAYEGDLSGRDLPVRINDITHLLDNSQRTANLTLTLTNALQQAATAALGPRIGAVVALDPNTGAILAMVSQPTYNPNELASHDDPAVRRSWTGLNADPGRPLLARAYRERYPPGSTFKVVTASATFDRMPALATKNYPVTGNLALPQTTHTLHNFGGETCGGVLADLLRLSCDTGFAQMGLDLGATNLTDEAAAFGFGARPPLDLPSVASSNFPDSASFTHNLPGIAFSAIGQQNVTATPLQMALVASAIADHGVIMRPHVMASITDSDGRPVRSYQPMPWMQATTAQTADTMRQLMIGVVTSGTGTGAALPGIPVAAKTGTAEVDLTHTDAWMIAFAPADNPKIAVAVVLPGLTGIGNEVTGGVRAAPIVRAVLAAYLGIKL